MKKGVITFLLALVVAVNATACGFEEVSEAVIKKGEELKDEAKEIVTGELAGKTFQYATVTTTYNADGTINNISECEFEIDDHTITFYWDNDGKEYYYNEFTLDDKGRAISNIYFYSSFKIDHEMSYDDDGRIIKQEILTTYDDESKSDNTTEYDYFYDDSGKLERMTYNGTEQKLVYEGNQLVEIEGEDSKQIYHYDENGRVTALDFYVMGDSGWYLFQALTYDGSETDPINGKLYSTKTEIYDEWGELDNTSTFEMTEFVVNEQGVFPKDETRLRKEE